MNQIFQMQDLEVGKRYLLNELKRKNYQWRDIIYTNNKRYMLILGYRRLPNYFVMFKRSPFFSFGDIFKGKSESGETINALALKDCLKNKVRKIFIIYPNGNVYYQTKEFWLTKGFKRTNREGKITYSISIKDLKRFNKDQEKKI